MSHHLSTSPGAGASDSTPGRPSRDGGFIEHEIKITDTLQGISLKYGVPIEDIKKANKLYSNMIHGHVSLKIPFDKMRGSFDKSQSAESEHRRLARKFQTELKVPAEDARYYLGQCEYRYAEAVALYHQHSAEIEEKRRQGIPFHSPEAFTSVPTAMRGTREISSVDKQTKARLESIDSNFYDL